jgi:hypothetical protein
MIPDTIVTPTVKLILDRLPVNDRLYMFKIIELAYETGKVDGAKEVMTLHSTLQS